MSIAPTKPDLVWRSKRNLNYLLWRGGLLIYCDKEPNQEEFAAYEQTASEVEANNLDPTYLPGREMFHKKIYLRIWEIRAKQRDASSPQSLP